jgi:hypothetical protein
MGGVRDEDVKFICRVLNFLKVANSLTIDVRGNVLSDASIKSLVSCIPGLRN